MKDWFKSEKKKSSLTRQVYDFSSHDFKIMIWIKIFRIDRIIIGRQVGTLFQLLSNRTIYQATEPAMYEKLCLYFKFSVQYT